MITEHDITPHFRLSEFCRSQTASRRGWPWPDMPADVFENVRRLCEEIGEPLRAELGVPIRVTSGWRYPKLNRAIGGSRNSAHIDGRAMDIVVPGVSLYRVASAAVALPAADKVILEFGLSGWLHVQIARPGRTARNLALCAYKRRGRFGRMRTCYGPSFDPPDNVWVQ